MISLICPMCKGKCEEKLHFTWVFPIQPYLFFKATTPQLSYGYSFTFYHGRFTNQLIKVPVESFSCSQDHEADTSLFVFMTIIYIFFDVFLMYMSFNFHCCVV